MSRILFVKAPCCVAKYFLAIGLLSILSSSRVEASFIAYDAQYDPVSGTSIFTNHSDSMAPLRTFSSAIDPSALGGAFNPLWIAPGDSISFFSDGTYSTLSLLSLIKPIYINGTVDKDKIFTMTLETPGVWHKWDEINHKWVDHTCAMDPYPTDCTSQGKRSDWYDFEYPVTGMFNDGDYNYSITWGFVHPNQILAHVGADEPGQPIPPLPGETSSSLLSPINYFEPYAPAFLLASGLLTVPHTDTLDFMSVYTPNAGAGSVPEPSSALLVIIGLLGLIAAIGDRPRFRWFFRSN